MTLQNHFVAIYYGRCKFKDRCRFFHSTTITPAIDKEITRKSWALLL